MPCVRHENLFGVDVSSVHMPPKGPQSETITRFTGITDCYKFIRFYKLYHYDGTRYITRCHAWNRRDETWGCQDDGTYKKL